MDRKLFEAGFVETVSHGNQTAMFACIYVRHAVTHLVRHTQMDKHTLLVSNMCKDPWTHTCRDDMCEVRQAQTHTGTW